MHRSRRLRTVQFMDSTASSDKNQHKQHLTWRDVSVLHSPLRTIEVVWAQGSKLTIVLYQHGSAPITVAGPALDNATLLILALDIRRSDRGIGTLHRDDAMLSDSLRDALSKAHGAVEAFEMGRAA